MKKTLLSFLFFFHLIALFAQLRKDVLFIGNSYTEVNNLPQLVSFIATSKGDTLFYDSNTPGGCTLEIHSTDPVTINKIKSKPWDYVVLQEQSQRPSFPPEQVQLLVYPFADSLNRIIKTNDSCTITTFYMTWGRKNGDAEYCPTYPPVCTYSGMQSRLRQSYLEMVQMFDANVAPVGIVWKKTRDLHPEIELYQADESHPSLAGSYIAACTFYASIFHKNPVGAYIPAGLDPAYALIIQNYANEIVFDSLPVWNIDTATIYAAFSYIALQDGRVEFTNTSRNATSFLWNFGDGHFSTEINPVHIYQYCGTTYQVSLVASNNCENVAFLKEILVPCSGINEFSENKPLNFFPNPADQQINFEFTNPLSSAGFYFELFDALGKTKMTQFVEKNTRIISLPQLPNGIYFIRLNLNGKFIYYKIQIIQHK